MFVLGTGIVIWLGISFPDMSGELAITIWCWLALGMVPVCVWYYGRSSAAMPRRGGSSDAQLAKGFFWGGWIFLGVCVVIAVGGAYGAASILAILGGFNMIAVGVSRHSTARSGS
jgi:hypothetical protein